MRGPTINPYMLPPHMYIVYMPTAEMKPNWGSNKIGRDKDGLSNKRICALHLWGKIFPSCTISDFQSLINRINFPFRHIGVQ